MSFLKGTEPAEIAASLRELADAIAKGEYLATRVKISTEQDRARFEIVIDGYRRRYAEQLDGKI